MIFIVCRVEAARSHMPHVPHKFSFSKPCKILFCFARSNFNMSCIIFSKSSQKLNPPPSPQNYNYETKGTLSKKRTFSCQFSILLAFLRHGPLTPKKYFTQASRHCIQNSNLSRIVYVIFSTTLCPPPPAPSFVPRILSFFTVLKYARS